MDDPVDDAERVINESTNLGELDAVVAELYALLGTDTTFEEKTAKTLELGKDYLGVDNGHLTRIDQGTNFWEALVSTDDADEDIPPGLMLDLDTTFCRRTIAKNSPLALHNTPEQGWANDPAFQTHELHCYLGTKLTVEDEVFGTVCFASHAPKEDPFTGEERLFVELLARLLEHELEYTRHQAELDRRETVMNVLGRVLRHNLRNDMTVVRGQVRMLTKELTTGREQAEEIIEVINGLLALSDTAREFGAIDSANLEHQPLEVMSLVNEVVEIVTRTYPTATVTVEGPDDVTLVAMTSLSTALEELIENAIKHAGDDPQVTLFVEEQDETVEIHVSDNGPGLPEQEQQVLERGTESPLMHGSGLGLWLVEWIVSDHGGSIRAAVDETGTTITVSLPREGTDIVATEEDTKLLLQRAKDQFYAVWDESNDAMVIADDEGRYIEANPAAVELFGTPREELLGQSVTDYAHDDFEFEQVWQSFVEQGHQQGEFTLVRPDGTDREVQFSAVADIIPGMHLSVLRDITERKARERELRTFRQAAEHAGHSIVITDVDGTIDYVNPAFEKSTGYSQSEVLGENPRILNSGEHDQAFFEELWETILNGEVWDEVVINRRKSGELYTVDQTIAPITDETGSIEKFVAINNDITAIKDQERTLQAIFDNTYTFVGLLDRDGIFREINHTALAFGGISADEVKGKPIWETYWFQVDDDTRQTVKTAVQQAQNGDIVRERMTVQGETGKVDIDFTIRPVMDDSGTVTMLIPEGKLSSEEEPLIEYL